MSENWMEDPEGDAEISLIAEELENSAEFKKIQCQPGPSRNIGTNGQSRSPKKAKIHKRIQSIDEDEEELHVNNQMLSQMEEYPDLESQESQNVWIRKKRARIVSSDEEEEDDYDYEDRDNTYDPETTDSSDDYSEDSNAPNINIFDELDKIPENDYYKAFLESNANSKKKATRKKKIGRKSVKSKRNNTSRRINNVEGSDGAQSDSESIEGSESSENKKKEAQYVTIHRILLNRVELDPDSRISVTNGDLSEEEAVIYKIMYDANIGKRGEMSHYEEKRVQDEFQPKLSRKDENLFKGEHFSVKVFIQLSPNELQLMSAYGVHCQSISAHIIVFHYREGEIFALTTNQAWNVVQWCSDYSFPLKIAHRLLSEKGTLMEESRTLIGNTISEKKTRKVHEASNPYELVHLVKTFKASFRERSSIRQFSAFVGKKETNVQIGLAGVRILKKLQTSDFLAILSHFSVIDQGFPTHLIPNVENVEEVEKDTDVHRRILRKVSPDMGKILDLEVSWRIRQVMRNGNLRGLGNFEVRHKHFEEFANGSEFKLKYNTQVFHNFEDLGRPPTLPEIIENLRKCPHLTADYNPALPGERGRGFANEKEWFKDRMDRTKLSYKNDQGVNKRAENLLKYLEGIEKNPRDGRFYWRVIGDWCSISDDYLVLVHHQFTHLLGMNLLEMENEDSLKKAWSPNGGLEEYLSRHEVLGNFLVWKAETEDEPLFDLAKFNQNGELCLYYILEGFDSSLVQMAERLKNAPHKFKNAKTYSTKQKAETINESYDLLDKFYRKNAQKPFFRVNNIRNIKGFLDAMCKAKIILGIAQPGGDFMRERDLGKEIKSEMIENILGQEKNLDFAQQFGQVFEFRNLHEIVYGIHNGLIEAKYIDENGGLTNKLLMASREDFWAMDNHLQPRSSLKKLNQFIFEELIKELQSGFNSYLPKLALHGASMSFSDNPENQFKICQIPY